MKLENIPQYHFLDIHTHKISQNFSIPNHNKSNQAFIIFPKLYFNLKSQILNLKSKI